MPTTTAPIDRLHLLIEPRNIRQGRGSPQCAVRRGLGLGREALGLASSFAGLPIRLRNASRTLARPFASILCLSALPTP
jgi:hypothetical protein